MPGVGLSGERTPGSGIGASSTFPVLSVWIRNGPNSSPNHSVPSRATRKDSMSKSPPVRRRSGETSGKGTLWCGSRSEIQSRTLTEPRPPRRVSKSARTV